jgi:hypothetical protein
LAVTIFAIYLKVGWNYYVKVDDMEDKPLVLGPFATYQKQFGPIEFYAVNNKRINLNRLLDDRGIRWKLVLSTSDGRYRVRSHIHRWNPVSEYFDNHLTGILRPVRSTYKGKDLGSNISYVVEIV